MVIFLQWGWLLGIALLAPISLPAGGAQFLIPHVRYRKSSDPFLTTRDIRLRSTPLKTAPTLRLLPAGTPFKVVRFWQESEDSQLWIYVQVPSQDKLTLDSVRNGWLDA